MAKRRANNEGTIFKRSNGSWRAQISLNGQRLSFTGQTQKECQNWIKEIVNQIDHGYSFDGANTSLEDFLHNWIESIASSRSKTTVNLYRRTIKKEVIPILGKILLKDLSSNHIQGLYDRKRKSGKSDHAIHMIHKVLRGAFSHAIKLGLLPKNPCKATVPPKPGRTEMNIYVENQVQILLNTAIAIGDRFYPIYHLAVHTGMRQAELLGVMWKDIDWDKKTLKVQRQALRHKGGGYEFTKPKSKSGIRTIILGDKMLEILRTHQTDQWETRKRVGDNWVDLDLIFPSKVGTPVVSSNLRKSFRKLLEESGLPKIRFHDLRHTAASLMLNYGIPVIIASRRLGHAKPSITLDVYGHLIPSKQEEAATLMDDLLSPIDVSRCTIFAPEKRK